MADRVRAHTRKTASGGTTRVRQHGRASRPRKPIVSPRHAWKLARKAFGHARRKRRLLALVFGGLALTELAAWLTLEGVGLALTTAGVLAIAAGTAATAAGGVRR